MKETDSRGVLEPDCQQGARRPGALVSRACMLPLGKSGIVGKQTVLFVCTTCRAGQDLQDGAPTPGTLLAQALMRNNACEALDVRPTECLSACTQGCSIALARPGSWTYVYGRLSQADASDILAGATAYAQSADGIVPWRQRPTIFRKQSLARIPPLEP